MGLFSIRKKKKEKGNVSQTVDTTYNLLAPAANNDKNVSIRSISDKIAKEMADALKDPKTTETNQFFPKQNNLTAEMLPQVSEAPVSTAPTIAAPGSGQEQIIFVFKSAIFLAIAVYIIFTFSLVITLAGIALVASSLTITTLFPQILETVVAAESAVREVEREEKSVVRRLKRLFKSEKQNREEIAEKIGNKMLRNLENSATRRSAVAGAQAAADSYERVVTSLRTQSSSQDIRH